MERFKRLIDILALGSERPLRRLLAYYAILAAIILVLMHLVPPIGSLLRGEQAATLTTNSQLLQDGLSSAKDHAAAATTETGLALAGTTIVVMLSTLALMIPVSWVFMSARRAHDFSQGVVQTLIILPIVVAGIVLVVRTSLALAFSLGGIVAGLRFRTTMKDVRDTVYIFLGIGVGLAAGVQSLIVAAVLSIAFNFVVLLIWRYDFGRNVLEPTAGSKWAEPLGDLAQANSGRGVPDRDLVLALSPNKAALLANRFDRVHRILGSSQKRPRFNSILTVSTGFVGEAQSRIATVLDLMARRWRLDEVTTTEGKPSELYYLVGVRRGITREHLLTAIREGAGDRIVTADLEVGDAVAQEKLAAK